MNRRGFLGGLAGVFAGAALDPEKLLWRPGAKLISIPARRYGNYLIAHEMLARQSLITLQNNLMLTRAMNGEYGEFFSPRRPKIGDILNIRIPRAFIGFAR